MQLRAGGLMRSSQRRPVLNLGEMSIVVKHQITPAYHASLCNIQRTLLRCSVRSRLAPKALTSYGQLQTTVGCILISMGDRRDAVLSFVILFICLPPYLAYFPPSFTPSILTILHSFRGLLHKQTVPDRSPCIKRQGRHSITVYNAPLEPKAACSLLLSQRPVVPVKSF